MAVDGRGDDTSSVGASTYEWFSEAGARTLLAAGAGPAWLEAAPLALDRMARRFEIEIDGPLPGGHTGVTGFGHGPDGPVVAKLVFDAFFASREITSLGFLASSGRVPKVVAADPAAGFLATERILPGTPPSGSLSAVAELANALHAVPVPTEVPHVSQLLAVRRNEVVHRGQDLGVTAAQVDSVVAQLSTERPVLCHGDFGPANVLVGPGGLWAIDPECVIAPAAFDLAGYAIRQGARTAQQVALELACAYQEDSGAVFAWLAWMALDEAVCHRSYGLEQARAEWELAEALSVLGPWNHHFR